MIKHKIIGAVTALFLLTATPAQAANGREGPVWIEEFEFVSETENFNYTQAPNTVNNGGRVYTKTGEIKYEKIEEVPLYGTTQEEISREVSRTGLDRQDDGVFPASITVDDGGQEAVLQRQSVQWTERTEEGRVSKKTKEVDYGVHTETPEAAATIQVSINGEEVEMELKEVRQVSVWQWVPNHIATVTLMLNEEIALDSDKPEWKEREAEVLEYLHLDPLRYILRDSRWAQSYNGGDSRKAVFVLDRYVARFSAIYQCEIKAPDKTLYDGTALYSGKISREVQTGKQYRAKAIVTYQAPPDPATPSPSPSPSVTEIPEITEPPQIEEAPEKKSAAPVAVTLGAGAAAAGGAIWYFFFFKKRGNSGGAVK